MSFLPGLMNIATKPLQWAGNLLSGGAGSAGAQGAAMADPFASQRGYYQGLLQNMWAGIQPGAGGTNVPLPQHGPGPRTGPAGTGSAGAMSGGITNFPGYSFMFDQGLQALERELAASGQLVSGQGALAAEQWGQQFAQTQFGNWEQMLAQLSGATIGSPAAAGQLYTQGALASGQAGTAALGGLLSQLGSSSAVGGAADLSSTWGASDALSAMATLA